MTLTENVKTPEIPPTAVGGLFTPSLRESRRPPLCFAFHFPSRREGREGEGKRESACTLCRPGLNHPPTPVGGSPGVFTALSELLRENLTRTLFETARCTPCTSLC
jgi:hypothetical protein